MGLDMYLFKSKRVSGLKAADYEKISGAVGEFKSLESFHKEFVSLREALPDFEGIEELDETLDEHGQYFRWVDIKTQVGYWRKANQIHNWFVENCQGGIDECQLSEVPKDKIEELLVICLDIQKNKRIAKSELPTSSGFFFGSTDYDDYYFEDIADTINILKRVLEETDFEKEIIFYRSSR